MSKAYCHNGYCHPIHKENEENHSEIALAKPTSIVSFMNIIIVVSVSIIAFVVAFIGGLLFKMFIL